MGDEDMDQCQWFRINIGRLTGWSEKRMTATEVNFAWNRLTSVGVRKLLETLAQCRLPVVILRLLHNRIEDGRDVAAFLASSKGSLRELHLSHNELDAAGAADVILAAAAAR